jgi:hypothetical protein
MMVHFHDVEKMRSDYDLRWCRKWWMHHLISTSCQHIAIPNQPFHLILSHVLKDRRKAIIHSPETTWTTSKISTSQKFMIFWSRSENWNPRLITIDFMLSCDPSKGWPAMLMVMSSTMPFTIIKHSAAWRYGWVCLTPYDDYWGESDHRGFIVISDWTYGTVLMMMGISTFTLISVWVAMTILRIYSVSNHFLITKSSQIHEMIWVSYEMLYDSMKLLWHHDKPRELFVDFASRNVMPFVLLSWTMLNNVEDRRATLSLLNFWRWIGKSVKQITKGVWYLDSV